MNNDAQLRDETAHLWENFYGDTDGFAEAWNAASKEGFIRSGQTAQALMPVLRIFQHGRDKERTEVGGWGDIPERPRKSDEGEGQLSAMALDAEDTLRLRALVLHELLVSPFGEDVRRFRAEFTGGRLLDFSEAHDFIRGAAGECRAEVVGQGGLIRLADLGREWVWLDKDFCSFFGIEERTLRVKARSCLGRASRLAFVLAGRYGWSQGEGALFLLVGNVPAMSALRLRPPASTLSGAFRFDSRNTLPLTIQVMPWMSPNKVARYLREWQRAAWVGKTKEASEVCLEVLVFVLSEMHRRQTTEPTRSERREIFDLWKIRAEADATRAEKGGSPKPLPPTLKKDAGRLFAAANRTLHSLTASAQNKREKRRRG